jgi:hypothetical protein
MITLSQWLSGYDIEDDRTGEYADHPLRAMAGRKSILTRTIRNGRENGSLSIDAMLAGNRVQRWRHAHYLFGLVERSELVMAGALSRLTSKGFLGSQLYAVVEGLVPGQARSSRLTGITNRGPDGRRRVHDLRARGPVHARLGWSCGLAAGAENRVPAGSTARPTSDIRKEANLDKVHQVRSR